MIDSRNMWRNIEKASHTEGGHFYSTLSLIKHGTSFNKSPVKLYGINIVIVTFYDEKWVSSELVFMALGH